jgi:hypothetical protein
MRELTFLIITLFLVGLWLGSASILAGISFWVFTAFVVLLQLIILFYALRDRRVE